MEKQIITFSANEQILKKTAGQEFFADDVVGYIEARFDLGDSWTGYDSIRAVWFTAFAQISTVLDQDGVCLVPPEVCNRKEAVNVNLVGSIVENDELTDRLTTYPIEAFIFDGNARVDGSETAPVTPSQFEQFVAIVKALVGSVKDIDHATLNADYTLTIYYSDGTSDTVGPIRGEQGPTGPTGNGIASIAKTGTSGTDPVVDTYTITYTNGQTTTFTVTNGVKGDTGNGIQSIYLTGTSGAVKTYTILMTDGSTFEFEVTDGEVTQAVLDQTVEDIEADIYESTIVQVKSDTDPYFFRKTNNGNGCGHTCHDEIVGVSVGWNQLANGVETLTRYDVTTGYNATTHKYSITNDGRTTNFSSGDDRGYLFTYTPNHKYISLFYPELVGVGICTDTVNTLLPKVCAPSTGTRLTLRMTNQYDFVNAHPTGNTAEFYLNVIDLTQMFGSTIADYIYTLEQGTAGSGVAFFRKYFDKDYYAYDSGSIKSVSGLASHDMTGFNQWDEEWELGAIDYTTGQNVPYSSGIRSKNYIPVIPNTSYYFRIGEGTSLNTVKTRWYDADKNYIGPSPSPSYGSAVTAPSNAHYLRFCPQDSYGTTYKNDICINISDADLNGQYKAYEKHSYPLDSTVTLRGKFDLVDGKLKANGDVYESDGTVTRNRTNGNITTASKFEDETGYFWYATTTNLGLPVIKGLNAGLLADRLAVTSGISQTTDEGTIVIYANGIIRWKEKGTMSQADYRTYLASNPIEIVYELATPTTDTATPYAKTQKVDPSGTEEYVSTGVVPVGHNTEYPMTLIDTMPKANGSYTMHLTVANGKRTISWS